MFCTASGQLVTNSFDAKKYVPYRRVFVVTELVVSDANTCVDSTGLVVVRCFHVFSIFRF